MAGTTDPALLAAQAKAGKAGVDAYEAAKTELAAQKQQAIATALAESASRGGPAGSGATIGATISAPYDQHIAALTAAQGRTGDAVANRDARMADYNASVTAARGLIGDQIRQTVAPIDARSNFQIRQLETQGRNQVQGIEANMRLTAAQGEARQAEWERQQAEAAAKAAAAAAKGSGGGGGGGGDSDKPKLNEGELKGLLTAGAIAKIQAAIANAGGFIEGKNKPKAEVTPAAARTGGTTGNPNNQRDPRFIGSPGQSVTNTRAVTQAASPRNLPASTQRGTTVGNPNNQRDPRFIGGPAVPRSAPASSDPATIRDPRFIGGPVRPVQRPTANADNTMDPRFIGNPAVPVRRPNANNARDPWFIGNPAVPVRRPNVSEAAPLDPRVIGNPVNPARPGSTPGTIRDPRIIGNPAVPVVPPGSNPATIRDPRFIGNPAVPVQRPNVDNTLDPRFIGTPSIPDEAAQLAAQLAARGRTPEDSIRDPRFIGQPAVPVTPAAPVPSGRTPEDSIRDPRFIGNPAVPTGRAGPTPESLARNLSHGGARPAGPGDVGWIPGPGETPNRQAFTRDELDFFLGTPEGAIYSALVGSGAPAPTSAEDVADIIGSNPDAMQNAMALVAMDLQQQGYEIDPGELAAAMDIDQTYQPGYSLADTLGVQGGLGTVEEQAKAVADAAKAKQDELDLAAELDPNSDENIRQTISDTNLIDKTTTDADEKAAAQELFDSYGLAISVPNMSNRQVADLMTEEGLQGAMQYVDQSLAAGAPWADYNTSDADGNPIVAPGIKRKLMTPVAEGGAGLDPSVPGNRKYLAILEAYAKVSVLSDALARGQIPGRRGARTRVVTPRRRSTTPSPSAPPTTSGATFTMPKSVPTAPSPTPAPPTTAPPKPKPTTGGGSGATFQMPELLPAPPVPAPQEAKARSLWEQVKDPVFKLPQGILALGGQAGKTVAAPAFFGLDAIRGMAGDQSTTLGELTANGFQWSDFGDWQQEYLPLTSTLQHSFGQTGYALTHAPTEYPKAVREGRIVDRVLEDAANLSIVFSAAGKALGFAGTAATAGEAGSLAGAAEAASLPVRTAGFLESTGAVTRPATVRSLSSAAAEGAASTGGRAVAESVLERLGPAPTVVDAAGKTVPLTTPVLPVGTGLSGIAQRAGYARTATALETAGKVARGSGQVSDAIGNSPFLAYTKPLGYAAKKLGVKPAISQFVSRAATRAAEGEGFTAGLVKPFTVQGRQGAQVRMALGTADTVAIREALTPEKVAQHFDLSPQQGRTALSVLDNRWQDAVDLYRANRAHFETAPDVITGVEGTSRFGTALEEMIDEKYGDIDPSRRPTADDIRELADYYDGKLDPALVEKIDTVGYAQEELTRRRTNEELRQGRLNPEQLENELRPSVVEAERTRRLGRAEDWHHEWEGAHTRQLHLDRVANARVALNEQLPPPPDIKAGIDAGVASGWKMAKLDELERAVDEASIELENAVDEYVTLTEGPVDSPELRDAARNVERATDRVTQLKTKVKTQARQADAMKGLETATGEIEVKSGGESVLDLEGGGSAAARERVMEGAEPVLDKVSVKQAVDDAHAQAKQEVLDAKEQFGGAVQNGPTLLTNKQREAVSTGHETTKTGRIKPGTGQLPGEYDHWVFKQDKFLTREQRLKRNEYVRRGYLGKASDSALHRTAPDQWLTAAQEGNPLLHGVDEATALDQFLEIADREIALDAARSGIPSREILERAADSLDADPALLADALGTGTKEGFRQSLLRDTDAALTDLHARYGQLTPDQQTSMMSVLNEMAGDSSYTALDLLDAMEEYLPGSTARHDIFERLSNGGIEPRDVIEFMQSENSVVTQKFYRAVTAPPSIAQYRQQAATAAELQRNKGRLSEAVLHERAAVRNMTAAEYAQATHVDHVKVQVDEAAAALDQVQGDALDAMVEAVEANQAAGAVEASGTWTETIIDEDGSPRTVVHNPHKRTTGKNKAGETTHPKSPYERALVAEGIATTEAGRAATKTKQAQRYMDGWLDKAANTVADLSARWQDNLHTKVTVPAINGFRRTIRSIAPEVGRYIEAEIGPDGALIRPASVNGLSGRIAQQFDFMDEYVNRIEDLRRDLPRGQRLGAIEKADAFYAAANDAGVVLDDLTTTKFDDSWQADALLEDISALELNAQMQGTRMNLPHRVIDLIQQQEWINNRVGPAGTHVTRNILPSDPGSILKAQGEAYLRRQSSYLNRLMDQNTRAAPAVWRAPMLDARRNVAALVTMAEKYNKLSPGSGDAWLRMAEDSATTMSEMIDKGIDPTHLIGGKVIERPTGRTGGGLGSGGRIGLAQRKTMAQFELGEGLRPMDPAVYARTEATEAVTLLHNKAAELVNDKFGTTVESIIGDQIAEHKATTGRPMPAAQMEKLIEDAGYKAGTTITNEGSTVIPKIVHDQLVTWTSNTQPGGFEWYLTKWNRGLKISVLPFSARWHIGNIIGNSMMATVYGGMGPLELANTLRQIVKSEGGWKEYYKSEGLPSWAPEELATNGLSYGDHNMMWNGMTVEEAATRMQSAIAKSYNVNQFFDNMFRSAVFISKVKKGLLAGVDDVVGQATEGSLRAMGDYSRMTSFERKWVRQIFPFYPWLRHQTTAAMRLPLLHPLRAAWLYNLSNVYGDKEMTAEAAALLGSRIPLPGGGALNLGGIIPFPNLLRLPLDPRSENFPQNISLGLTVPAKLALGIDVDQRNALTRPESTSNKGLFGEEVTTPPLARPQDPMESLYVLAGELPYARPIRDLLMPGSRYDTGQLRPKQYEKRDKPWYESATSLLNLPTYQPGVDEDVQRVNEANNGVSDKKKPRRIATIAESTKPGG